MTQRGGADRGLQIERTELAWQRSALSVLVLALVLARSPLGAPDGAAAVVAYAIVLMVPLLVHTTARRYATRHHMILATGTTGPDRRVLFATVVATTLGLAALAIILVG